MKDSRAFFLAAIALFFAFLAIQACSNPTVARQLISITLAPISGTAPGASGQVQYVATGIYNTYPYAVTPLTATWGVYDQTIATSDTTGLSTCKATGTTTVVAWVEQAQGPVCLVIGPGGVPCGAIAGRAQLTCP